MNSFPGMEPPPASPGGIAEIQTAMMQSKLKAAEPQFFSVEKVDM